MLLFSILISFPRFDRRIHDVGLVWKLYYCHLCVTKFSIYMEFSCLRMRFFFQIVDLIFFCFFPWKWLEFECFIMSIYILALMCWKYVISHSLNFAVKFCTDGLHYHLNFAALAWSPLLRKTCHCINISSSWKLDNFCKYRSSSCRYRIFAYLEVWWNHHHVYRALSPYYMY